MPAPLVWLASYPRSGNTFLRTILFNCFGVRSASIYARDFDARSGLEGLTGHIEHNRLGGINFGGEPVRLMKTHNAPTDDGKAIYILRDGREATTSLFHFYDGKMPLKDVILGRTKFGTWTEHIEKWSPRTRPNTLLIRYEDLVDNLPASIAMVGEFLGLAALADSLPSRDSLAENDGRWIRPSTAPRDPLKGQDLALFLKVNRAAMKDYGYL